MFTQSTRHGFGVRPPNQKRSQACALQSGVEPPHATQQPVSLERLTYNGRGRLESPTYALPHLFPDGNLKP
jgi:hypothetical protein